MNKLGKNVLNVLFFIVLILISLGAYFYYVKNNHEVVSSIPELEEVVSDVAPNGWVEEKGDGYKFYYPASLSLDFINLVDWPPAVQLLTDKFSCTEAGDEIAVAGKTTLIEMDGVKYCRTQESEGAAGSIYNQYAYAFDFEDKTMVMTFTTRQPQCLNYDSPQSESCMQEENQFNPDQLIDSIVKTVKPN